MKKECVLVIGGGYPQLSLIEAFSTMGFRPVIIDDRPNIPAHKMDCTVIPIGRYDIDSILDFVRKSPPDFVSSGGSDKAVYIMALVAEMLGIPTYVSSKVAELPMNKNAIRNILADRRLPVPKTFLGDSLESFEQLEWSTITFPVVIKPDEGIGQTAVDKAGSKEEALQSIENAFAASQNGKVLLQEFVSGPEIDINGIVVEGVFKLLTTSYRNSSRQRGGAFGVAMQKVYPAITDQRLLLQVEQIIGQACSAIGVTSGPIYSQVIQTGDSITIVEIMPRLGGGEDPRLVHIASGYNLSKATALLSIGRKLEMQKLYDLPPSNAAVLHFLHIQAGSISSIDGIEKARSLQGIQKIDLFFQKGDRVKELSSSRERGGYILSVGDTVELAIDSAQQAEAQIKIETL